MQRVSPNLKKPTGYDLTFSYRIFIAGLCFLLIIGCDQWKMARKPASFGTDYSRYIEYIPGAKYRHGMDVYFAMLGLGSYGKQTSGGANHGIAHFNQTLLDNNECFRKLAANFYLDVARWSAFYSRATPLMKSNVSSPLSLSTNESFAKEKWLWNLALKKAGNDGNLAMALIGICGHDNTSQLPTKKICEGEGDSKTCKALTGTIPFASPEQVASYRRYKKEEFNNTLRMFQPQDSKGRKVKELLQDKSVSIQFDGSQDEGIKCPSSPSVFVQGSLGRETLLPHALIDKISRIQSPNKGAEFLPSKYYHVIGAAAMTCSLVRAGYPGFVIKKIQRVAINSYRMIRLCDAMEINGTKLINIGNSQGFSKLVDLYRKDRNTCSIGESFQRDGITYDFNIEQADCFAVKEFKDLIADTDVSEAILKEKYIRLVGEVDAYKMFQKYVLKDGKCKEAQIFDGRIDKMEQVSKSTESCIGLSPDRCRKAQEVLSTWWVDFKWSEAQQVKGAEFAIRNCKQEPDFLENGLEKKSCSALTAANEEPTPTGDKGKSMERKAVQ